MARIGLLAATVSGCAGSTAGDPEIVLQSPPRIGQLPGTPRDDLRLVRAIRRFVIENSPETAETEMKDYVWGIPLTGVSYDMVAIKGGEFLMGSPPGESGRNGDEGPRRQVAVEPFWMGKFEVTWDMYKPFMITHFARSKDGTRLAYRGDELLAEVVSAPTTPYAEQSFGMGEDGYPAINMTHHAASKFCQWLSAQTGHYYRLPTEAEWEYACRAGTTGPYHCNPEELADYAVFDPDQRRLGYEKVGTRKPNPWGLHDMHGNVFEWCLDQYFADGYAIERESVPAKELYPRVARGGSWYDPAAECRSAARLASSPEWKLQDPQLPRSYWYHTDATWLGFRIVRPLKIPPPEEMEALWNSGAVLDDKDENR